MVLRGLGKERGAKSMSTSPKRSNRLHNFSLPFLKWGSQRHLRCTNVAVGAGAGASGSGDRFSLGSNSDESTATRKRSGSKRRVVSDDEEGIAVVREKLMLDLKTAADRMKDAILRNEEEEEKEEERDAEAVRPWNLRTRRAECKSPVDAGQKKRDCSSSPATTDAAVRCSRLRRNNPDNNKTERVKFSVPLSRKEVEEDFMAMAGRQPQRRPNKRPKVVQKQLDTLFPGLWLTEVTADLYKVLDPNENGKVRHSEKGKGKDALLLSDSDG